ncbi:unnamed protein product [Cochlearia groenlandica]
MCASITVCYIGEEMKTVSLQVDLVSLEEMKTVSPLQATTVGHLGEVDVSLQVDLVVDLTEDADFVVHEESEEEVGEFEEGSDSATEDSTESE